MPDVILEFLKSNYAIYYLGLPGFVCLLAFVFYRGLVSAGIIQKLRQQDSFYVVMGIIGYFLIVSVLAIWLYRPQHPQITYSFDEVAKFVAQLKFETPASSIERYFGPPKIEEPWGNGKSDVVLRSYHRAIEASNNGQIILVTYTEKREVVGYVFYAQGVNMEAPLFKMGYSVLERVETYKLPDVTLSMLADSSCEGAPSQGARTMWLQIGDCYFGRPGNYFHFAFSLQPIDGQAPECADESFYQAWWKAAKSQENYKDVHCPEAGHAKAIAIAVVSDDAGFSARNLIDDFEDRLGVTGDI